MACSARREGEVVAAIVVTYRRTEMLIETVGSLAAQSRPVQNIVVVDNDGDDATGKALERAGLLDAVVLLPQRENFGFEGGLAIGMGYCAERIGPDWFWLLDDDSPVVVDALRNGLRDLSRLPANSVLANRGADLVAGRVHSVFGHTLTAPRPIDVCLFDGTLYPRAAIDAVGLPRTDYFLMFGDYEYALRLGRAGFGLFVGPSVHSLAGYSGRQSSPPWRGYYQTRNHVRTALAARSPVLLYGALDRATRQMLASALRRENRASLRNRLRLLGIWHGFTGQMGRRLDPTDPRYR